MHKLMEYMVAYSRQDADAFMIENGLMSCWVACDHNGDVYIYASKPYLANGGYWLISHNSKPGIARKAKRVFRFPFSIESPDQLITEMSR